MIEFLKEQLQHNQFLITGLIVSFLGAIVIILKQAPGKIYDKVKDRIVFTATIYQTDSLYDDFENWFFAKYKNKYRNVEAVSVEINSEKIGYAHLPHENTKATRQVKYKQIAGYFIIKHNGAIVTIKKGRDKLEHTNDLRSLYMNQYHISCINGSKVIKNILQECINFNQNSQSEKLKIFTHDSYGNWVVSGYVTPKDLDVVILPKEVKKNIVDDIENFKSSKDWYKQASIFYKRGHLYHGLPGNGKTSLSLAIASYMGRDLYCMDLNSISENANLKRLFQEISSNGVLLIEDIDGFYNLRQPVKKDSKLSFSTFLNCLDGAFYKEGLFTIITTNKIDCVDHALKRNGRMGFVLEIPQPSIEEVTKYVNIFFNTETKLSAYSHNYSMCDIQEICLTNKTDLNKCLQILQVGALKDFVN